MATWVLHQGEFDRKSGKAKSLRLSARWRKELAEQHARLSQVSRKTMRLDRLSAYHRVIHDTAEKCWENRSKTRLSREAFGVWSRSTALLDSFWAGGRRGREREGPLGMEGRTMRGYGDWAPRKGGGGPTKRVRDSAFRVFRAQGPGRILMVDEFRTSKTCHCCGDVLRGVVEREKNFKKGAPAGAVDRGVKHCARSTCSTFLDRDVNAALNMLKVTLTRLRGEERPQHLQRESVLITSTKSDWETASTLHGVIHQEREVNSPMIIRRGQRKKY